MGDVEASVFGVWPILGTIVTMSWSVLLLSRPYC